MKLVADLVVSTLLLVGSVHACFPFYRSDTCTDETGGIRQLGDAWTSADCSLDLVCTDIAIFGFYTFGCSNGETCEADYGDLAQCVSPHWSEWSDWTGCSQGCTPGKKMRTRDCLPLGATCSGVASEEVDCVCDYTYPSEDCNQNGYMADPCDCTKYLWCHGGIMYQMPCAPGTEWTAGGALPCDLPQAPPPAVLTDNQCRLGNEIVVERNEDDHHKYYWLVHGHWMPFTCALGTIFKLDGCLCDHDPNYTPPATNSDSGNMTCLAFDDNFQGSNGVWVENNGAQIIDGKAYFDGSSDIKIPYFRRYDSHSFAISFWMKRTGTSTGVQSLVSNGICGESDASFEIQSEGQDSIGCKIQTTSGTASHNGIPAQGNSWHHVAVVYDGNTLKMYVDGMERTSGQTVGGLTESSECDLFIGHGFTGLIDNVCFYYKPLTETAVFDILAEGP